jgi:DNA-binding NarL/FixJ family response regulator
LSKIRVLLIEDNRLLREGIESMLNEQPDIKAVSSSGSNGDTFQKAEKLKPHVVLLDLGLKNFSSLKLVELIRKKFPNIQIVVMDIFPANPEVADYVNAGVSGFILKDATLKDFLHTIRSVHKGMKVLPPAMTDSLFAQIVDYAVKKGKTDLVVNAVRLTRREQEIIKQIAEGASNKEISRELDIAVHTVKSHVHNTLEKLALKTRLQLANFAHSKQVPQESF